MDAVRPPTEPTAKMFGMRLPFDIVDVFADQAFAGNQLAVVRDGETLAGDQCLTLAREFGFSETTFPVAVSDEEYSTRIFTPGGEIPFAGHPTLGTAWVLRSHGLLVGDSATQVCAAGRFGVTFGELVSLSAAPHDLVGPLATDLVEALLADLGLAIDDLAGEVWLAGAGLTFVHVPVVGSAIASARPSARPLAAYGERLSGGCQDPVEGINLHAVSGAVPHLEVHARVFVPGAGIPEDAATGSSAAGLGMALVATGVLPRGGSYVISQGAEIGRPSRLVCRVAVAHRVVAQMHVAGMVHLIASGEIELPHPADRRPGLKAVGNPVDPA